jgi:hypothetical protein
VKRRKCQETGNTFNILVLKSQKKGKPAKHRCSSEDSMSLNLREHGFKYVEWTDSYLGLRTCCGVIMKKITTS